MAEILPTRRKTLSNQLISKQVERYKNCANAVVYQTYHMLKAEDNSQMFSLSL